jgi:hypothetical protein
MLQSVRGFLLDLLSLNEHKVCVPEGEALFLPSSSLSPAETFLFVAE